MARQLSFFDLFPDRADLGTIEAIKPRADDGADIATLLAPNGELQQWLQEHAPRGKIGDLLKKLSDQNHDQSGPPDWLDDLPSPQTLQGIVVPIIADLINDIRDALPDQVQDWPSWLQNPANVQALKTIVMDHIEDLIEDVREALPDELQDWSGWADLGNRLPDLGSIGDHLGDLGHVFQGADPSQLQEWRDVAHATIDTIKDAAQDQFGDLGSLSDILGRGQGHNLFEDFFDFRPDSAITPDL